MEERFAVCALTNHKSKVISALSNMPTITQGTISSKSTFYSLVILLVLLLKRIAQKKSAFPFCRNFCLTCTTTILHHHQNGSPLFVVVEPVYFYFRIICYFLAKKANNVHTKDSKYEVRK